MVGKVTSRSSPDGTGAALPVYTADMALLEFRRLIADGGGTGDATDRGELPAPPRRRRRVNGMWLAFHRHRHSLAAVAVVARKPAVQSAVADDGALFPAGSR